ncbi:MAG: hypothetical protein WAN12_00820 [Candidatus Acidiferrum sp.]
MKNFAALTLSLFLTTGAAFADSPKDTPKKADAQPAKSAAAAKPATSKTSAEIAAEVEELRQSLQAQQEQLQMLKEELAKRDRQIEEAREAAAAANSRATEANVKASEAAATSAEVKTTTTALNSSVASLASSNAAAVNAAAVATGDQKPAEEKGPTTIRYKGVNITPGGFIAAETVNRQRAESADINTPFNAIPYGGNAVGKMSEMNLTARQSRLTLMADTKVGDTKVTSYYEADWLGTGVTSNNRQSNSYVFRQRQLWGRAEFASGWSFTGGQMWSLATETKKGIRNNTEWTPAVIDPQYVVGFTWQRAYGARLVKNFGDKFALAVSAEGPQATLTAHGNSTYTSASGAVNTNAFVFAPGQGGGLLNFSDTTGYAVNKTPDFVFKAALDPGWGHYEVFGILSSFQNRVYPCAIVSIQSPTTSTATVTSNGTAYSGTYTSALLSGAGALVNPSCTNTTPSAAGATTDSRTGGGGGASLDLPLFHKKLDVGAKGFYGVGTGRFGSAQLADSTLRPDGTLALIHGGHWLGRLEWHVTPKFDLYGYVGGEYNARTAYAGYLSVTGTSASIPVTLTSADGTSSIVYPETQTTWKTSNTGIGGYGYAGANNSGCSTESAPGGTGTPSGGGSCTGDTRYIGEGSLGFWYKFYQGEKGRVALGMQYSYFYRTGWSGSGGTLPTGVTSVGPHAVDNMVWTSFRYYLP